MKLKIVLILGMHRSGTSLVAEILQHAGLNFGPRADLLPGSEFNQDGHFECKDILYLNDRILTETGFTWCTEQKWRLARLGQKTGAYQCQAQAIIQKNTLHANHFCWKEPRTSILLPFWRSVLANDFYAIITYRHPAGVAKSLYRRDYFPSEKSANLYTLYYQGILSGISPQRTCFVPFEELIAKPDQEIEKIKLFLTRAGIPLNLIKWKTSARLVKKEYISSSHPVSDQTILTKWSTAEARAMFTVLEQLRQGSRSQPPARPTILTEKKPAIITTYAYLSNLIHYNFPLNLKHFEGPGAAPQNTHERYYAAKILLLKNEWLLQNGAALDRRALQRGIAGIAQRANKTSDDFILLASACRLLEQFAASDAWLDAALAASPIFPAYLPTIHLLKSHNAKSLNHDDWHAHIQHTINLLRSKHHKTIPEKLLLAQCLQTAGEYASAMKALRALAKTPTVPAAERAVIHMQLSLIPGRTSKHTLADVALAARALEEKEPKTFWDWQQLGHAYTRLHVPQATLRCLKNAWAFPLADPRVRADICFAIAVMFKTSAPSEWRTWLQNGIKLLANKTGKTSADYFTLAEYYFQLGAEQRSQHAFQHLLKTKSTSDKYKMAAHFYLADILQKNACAGWEKHLHRALALLKTQTPLSGANLYRIATTYWRLAMPTESRPYWQQIAAHHDVSDAQRYEAYVHLSAWAKERNDPEWQSLMRSATLLLERTQESTASNWFILGENYFNLGELKKSAFYFKKIIRQYEAAYIRAQT